MRAFKDGNAVCITLDDFVNLQESPAVFVEGEMAETLERAKFNLHALDSDVIFPLIARLLVEDSARQVTPQTLPRYQVFFVLHDEYLPKFSSIIERREKLENGTTACWSVASDDVDFGDFWRKGSVSVDCNFIHDDYRVGDCVVFDVSKGESQ